MSLRADALFRSYPVLIRIDPSKRQIGTLEPLIFDGINDD